MDRVGRVVMFGVGGRDIEGWGGKDGRMRERG